MYKILQLKDSEYYYVTYPGEELNEIMLIKIFKIKGIIYELEFPRQKEMGEKIFVETILKYGMNKVRNEEFNSIELSFWEKYRIRRKIKELKYEITGCLECGSEEHTYSDCKLNSYRDSKCYRCFSDDHTISKCKNRRNKNNEIISEESICKLCGKRSHTMIRCSEKMDIFDQEIERGTYTKMVGKLKIVKDWFKK